MVEAENALGIQSNQHPDGWGVAFYVDGAPPLTKSPTTALDDVLFKRISGVVASETVLAHVRQATQGKNSVLNCHPFQYGRWVGAHNGDIPNLEKCREALLAEVAPQLRRFVLGETDSELIFFQFLSRLAEYGPLGRHHDIRDILSALRKTISRSAEISADEERPPLLTFMVTDGNCLVAVQWGKPLFYSTYKNRCADREVCPSLSPECEAPTRTGFVNHLIVSSEILQGENIWHELEEGEVITVDHRMKVMRGKIDKVELPTLDQFNEVI
ncbi:MAG: class II glutamine amidotransferase [Polyangiaceae bacterium]|nr:class II glutamine amidotransferase [Polyangiaceae bacterium]